MLFGGMRASLPKEYANIFLLGTCLASTVWFITLAIVANKTLDKFKKAIEYIKGTSKNP